MYPPLSYMTNRLSSASSHSSDYVEVTQSYFIGEYFHIQFEKKGTLSNVF